MSLVRALPLLAVALLAASCSKSPPDEPQPTAPWRASPVESAPTLTAHYRVVERCRAGLELRARDATPRGAFRVCRGELDVNLLDLEKSRGTLAIDLASIEMNEEAADGGRSNDATQRAQNWMDVGASRPEAERERLRWATFTLTAVDGASSTTAHGGKKETSSQAGEAPEDPDAGGGGEQRVVTFTAKGSLVLHGVRVELSVPMRARFEYATKATADVTPDRVSVETRRPLRVALATHDIKPRDSAGVFQAQDMKLFGRQVGREARVDVAFSLARAAK